jgi:putative Holliday junction resolvase
MYNAESRILKVFMRILAIDWGSKRIGLAISDPTGKIARPLGIINHSSRHADAESIINLSIKNDVDSIIIGVTYDDENNLTPSGRSAKRLGDEISSLFGKQVILWDESFTTHKIGEIQIKIGIPRQKRKGHQDDKAAVLILMDYLEKVIK